MPSIQVSRNVDTSSALEILLENGYCQCSRCDCLEDENSATSVVTNPGSSRNRDSEIWCEDCTDSDSTTCDYCGERTDDDEIQRDSATAVCSWCYENHYCTCQSCSGITCYENGSTVSDSGEWLCDSCLQSSYHYDSDSGEWYSEAPEVELEDVPTDCDIDLSRYTSGRGMGGYHGDSDTRNRWGIPSGAIAIELELEVKNRDAVANYLRAKYSVACERDGSLHDNRGMEIVFPPLPLTDTLERIEHTLADLRKLGAKAWNCGTGYGIHVNLDCRSWSETKVGAYCNQFGEVNRCWLEKLAGRTENHWSQYKRNEDELDIPTTKYSAAAPKNGGRLEVRIFRATLKTATAIGYVALCKDIERYIDEDLFRLPKHLFQWLLRNGSDATKELISDKLGQRFTPAN